MESQPLTQADLQWQWRIWFLLHDPGQRQQQLVRLLTAQPKEHTP